MFCSRCGNSVPDSANFCVACGSPVNRAEASVNSPTANQPQTGAPPYAQRLPVVQYPAPVKQPKPRKRHPVRRIILILLALVVMIFILSALVDGGDAPSAKRTLLNKGTLSSAGGTIKVDKPDSALNGLVLTVPAGAYQKQLDFSISESSAKSLDYGTLFQAATPVISIDNGHLFAAKPMTLRIPITKAADEFAMAFYLDGTTGKLEGIPCISQDNQSITVMTAHFSDVIVSKVKKNLLDGRIIDNEADTDFMPGMSDFFAPNYGSIAEPGGHCAGQSMAVIHYYNRTANDNYNGKSLRTEEGVDNNLLAATRDLWEDDSLAYRLCSRIQRDFKWDASVIDPLRDADDEITYYSFAYVMSMTHSPQLIFIYANRSDGTQSGHAMVVYGVSKDGLAIADPNYPGDLLRQIKAIRKADGTAPRFDLSPYSSAATAGGKGTSYTNFCYYGLYALMDFNAMEKLWDDVLAGRDVGTSLFPADLAFEVLTGRDTSRNLISKSLSRTMNISKADLDQVDPAVPGRLYITLPKADPDVRITVYQGTKQTSQFEGTIGRDANKYFTLILKPGNNDLGILYERKVNNVFQYVNFYRYAIAYSDAAVPTPTPTTAPAATTAKPAGNGLAGTWKLDYMFTSECQHEGSIAKMDHSLPFEDPNHLNKPYSTTVTLAANQIQTTDGVNVTVVLSQYSHTITYRGTLSADQKTIKGTLEGVRSGGQHWLKGTFTLSR